LWHECPSEVPSCELATNESGFTVLPAGYRYSGNGDYYSMGVTGSFWSSSEYYSNAWYRHLNYDNSNVTRATNLKRYGFSIRCLGD